MTWVEVGQERFVASKVEIGLSGEFEGEGTNGGGVEGAEEVE